MKILELEEDFSKNFTELSNKLDILFNQITKIREIDFESSEITKAILVRLKCHYDYQASIKTLLDKKVAAPAADFFVETMLFYFKAIFKIYNIPLEVSSEKSIERKRGSIRPDISIRKKDEVVAIIECKTQLGWHRYDWEKDFLQRENKLKEKFPNASAFLIVMTSSNWPGFKDDKKVGKKYFCLFNSRLRDVKLDKLSDYVLNPIEPLVSYFIENYMK